MTSAPKTAAVAAALLLSRREHSRDELRQKLRRRFDFADIDTALDNMAARGLLCERRFAAAYIRTHAQKFGRERLRRDLRRRGVGDDDITVALDGEIQDDEETRAAAVLEAKYGEGALSDRRQAQAARFMHARGFLGEDVQGVIKRHNRRAANKGE